MCVMDLKKYLKDVIFNEVRRILHSHYSNGEREGYVRDLRAPFFDQISIFVCKSYVNEIFGVARPPPSLFKIPGCAQGCHYSEAILLPFERFALDNVQVHRQLFATGALVFENYLKAT